jgi:hypothetical protein
MDVCLCIVFCQVEVSATSWSLAQRSPTDCGVSLCMIKKPRGRGGHSPCWAAEPERERERERNIYIWGCVQLTTIYVCMYCVQYTNIYMYFDHIPNPELNKIRSVPNLWEHSHCVSGDVSVIEWRVGCLSQDSGKTWLWYAASNSSPNCSTQQRNRLFCCKLGLKLCNFKELLIHIFIDIAYENNLTYKHTLTHTHTRMHINTQTRVVHFCWH